MPVSHGCWEDSGLRRGGQPSTEHLEHRAAPTVQLLPVSTGYQTERSWELLRVQGFVAFPTKTLITWLFLKNQHPAMEKTTSYSRQASADLSLLLQCQLLWFSQSGTCWLMFWNSGTHLGLPPWDTETEQIVPAHTGLTGYLCLSRQVQRHLEMLVGVKIKSSLLLRTTDYPEARFSCRVCLYTSEPSRG